MNEQNVNITLNLPVPAVNTIMAALGKLPFEQVFDLVMAIREQATPQLAPPPETPAES